jgi:hypothetical protein
LVVIFKNKKKTKKNCSSIVLLVIYMKTINKLST